MKLSLISIIKSILLATRILQLVYGQTNAEKAMQISFADLYNLQPLNCTPYIPPKVITLIAAYSTSVPANNDGSFEQTILAQYLMKCLLNSDYEL